MEMVTKLHAETLLSLFICYFIVHSDLELSCSTNDEIGVVIDCQGYEPDTFLQCSFDSGPLYPCKYIMHIFTIEMFLYTSLATTLYPIAGSIPIVLTINVHPSGTYSLHIVTSTAREDTVTYTITDKEVDGKVIILYPGVH